MRHTKVKDIMETNIIMVSPDDTLTEASRKMQEANCGCLPVGTGDKIEGVITDRDIVIRALAEGEDPAEKRVREYMTAYIRACDENDTLADAAEKMNAHNVSRLLVVDGNNHICGILTFGRIIRSHSNEREISNVVGVATGKTEGKAA